MKVLILGGGISGLSAAWFLKKKNPHFQITLLEKENRLGGCIQTEKQDGFLFEKGPRTFQAARSPHLLQLIEELNLSHELIFSDPSAARRYLWHQNKLRSLPSFLLKMLPTLLREPFIRPGTGGDESISDFAARRFNTRIADLLFDPLTLGIYAGDSKKLSIQSCFPKLCEWERTYGSLLKGMLFSPRNPSKHKGLFTLRSGMERLIEELQKQLDIELILNCPVTSICPGEVIAGGKKWTADQVFSALPSPFPKNSLSVVNLVFEGDVLPKKGYGYLVPSRENESILGMIWDSAVFPQQNRRDETRLTVMLKSGSIETALEAASRHLQIDQKPLHSSLFLAKEAIPQFEVGYREKLDAYQKTVPHLHLLGNYLEGPSVENCIQHSWMMLKIFS